MLERNLQTLYAERSADMYDVELILVQGHDFRAPGAERSNYHKNGI